MTLGASFATPSIHVDALTSRICLCFPDSVQVLGVTWDTRMPFNKGNNGWQGFCPTVDATYCGRHHVLITEFCWTSSSMLVHLVHSSVTRYVPDGVLVFGTITCIVGPIRRVTPSTGLVGRCAGMNSLFYREGFKRGPEYYPCSWQEWMTFWFTGGHRAGIIFCARLFSVSFKLLLCRENYFIWN